MTEMPQPLRLAILGAGGRGQDVYGDWILSHPERARVVAVADSVADRRESLAGAAGVRPEHVFSDWRDLLAAASDGLELDGVIVALPDRDHVDPTLAACQLDLPVLLEKPAAPSRAELWRLWSGVRARAGRVLIGHVLRYSPFWITVRDLVASGILGQLVTIRLEENIGFWHFAHSYVRGNWRRHADASPMVLAKTCHDLDLIRWLAQERPTRIASSGSLLHFRAENAPPNAPDRCLDGCEHADTCPFYAPRFYVEALRGTTSWPVPLLGPDTSAAGRVKALATGPYGRCVYHADNDVADHQQTLIDFPSGLTATLTASGFTGSNNRTLQLTGTRGELTGDMVAGRLTVDSFDPSGYHLPSLPAVAEARDCRRGPLGHSVIDLSVDLGAYSAGGDHRGHAGGDDGLMEAFVTAVGHGDTVVGGSLDDALDSHLMAFAAEQARLTGRTVPVTPLDDDDGPTA